MRDGLSGQDGLLGAVGFQLRHPVPLAREHRHVAPVQRIAPEGLGLDGFGKGQPALRPVQLHTPLRRPGAALAHLSCGPHHEIVFLEAHLRIVQRKGATYYGIAMAVQRICDAVVRNEKSVLPVSVALHGEFGIEGATLSLPSIVGSDGVEKIVPIALSEEEHTKLLYSADMLKSIFREL